MIETRLFCEVKALREQKKTMLEMLQYTLLMMIFTSMLIGGAILWEGRVLDKKEEKAVISQEDAKKIKWAQISKHKANSIVIDGEDVHIGGR